MIYIFVMVVINQCLDDLFGITIGGNRLIEWYGYIDKTGKFAIKKKRRYVLESFSCGRAIQWVWGPSEDKCFIDTSGRQVTEWFQDALPFSENMAAVKDNERFGFINLDGEIVVPCVYDDAEPFAEGMAAVCTSERWGFVNSEGELKIEPQFDLVMYFSEGLAAVVLNEKVGYVNKDGCFIIEPAYQEAARFSCGVALVNDCDYVDCNGEVVFSTDWNPDRSKFPFQHRLFVESVPINTWNNPTSKHRIIVGRKPRLQRIDSGKWYHSTVRSFSENVAVAGRGDRCGYIDLEGTFCIDPVFDYALPFSEGRALVYVDGLFGYIDRSGQYIARPQFERAYGFSDGYACALFPNGKYGYLDMDGNVAIKPQFSPAKSFVDGLARVGDRRSSM
jgi:hypothetical protein